MSQSPEILDFWLEQVGPEGWYVASEDVDQAIRARFGALVERALSGALDDWAETPEGALALLILLDQFTRNLNRGSGEAFAGDDKARAIARSVVARNLDLEIPEPGRQFFYLPFEHSESLADQDWSVTLFETRTPDLPENALWHAKQHRDVIRRFGRFPYRNDALGRETTAEEAKWLEEDGYRPGSKS